IYTFTIGPKISDFAGNQMDQNNNGINGEVPGDRFTGTFVINTTDNGRFLTGLYHDILGRNADTSGFVSLITPIENARLNLLPTFATTYVISARSQLITYLYQSSFTPTSTLGIGDLLGVAATPLEVSQNVSVLAAGGTPEQIIANLLSDDRYFNQTR